MTVEYGAVDPLETTARYTTLADVKALLRIPTANTGFDDRITRAIVAAEYALDAALGRSFPDTTLGIQGIPVAVKDVAARLAVRVYKQGDAPAGNAGSDDLFGALDLSEEIRSEISRSPLLAGFKVSWGVA